MGQIHKSLVDSGATRSLISMDLYNNLPRKPQMMDSELSSFVVANSESLPCYGKVELPVLMGSQYISVMFYVVPRLLHDMIIGRDCLVKHNAKIDYGRDVLQMELIEGMYSISPITIPPGATQWVDVKLRDRLMAARG